MKLILAAGIGSFIGGISRYLLSLLIHSKQNSSFPFGTLIVNLAGCLFIGLLFALAERTAMPESWRIFLLTGILGGFTTFSAFSMESIHLIKNGEALQALLYISLSVILGLALTYAGYSLGKVRLF